MTCFPARLTCLVLAIALSGVPGIVGAQAEDDYDAFGIVDDSATIDPAAPEGSGMAPPLPVPLTEDAAAPVAPDPGLSGVEAVPVAQPPSDWQPFSFAEVTAWMPPDFVAMQEDDEGELYFGGDKAKLTGLGFGVILMPSDEAEEMPPNTQQLVDKQVSLDGQAMRWRELEIEEGDLKMSLIMISRPRPTEPDLTTTLIATVYNMPMEQGREVLNAILGTVRVGTPPHPGQIGEGLNGLVGYDVPKDWRINAGPEARRIGFWPRGYSGYVVFSRGLAVTGDGGADEDVPAGVAPVPAEIYGQPADLFSWTQDQAEFYVGTRLVKGRMAYYRLNQCLDGERLGVMIAGAPDVIDAEEFRAVLGKFTLNLPSELTPCPDAPAAITQAAPAPSVADTAVQPPITGTAVDVRGVTYILPEGWTAQYDSPGDKIFASPDGRWTLLSFWWFPDEPLLGYDDIKKVENLVVDHEPVTRIHITTMNAQSIQNVTERARSNGDRFIFTLEGRGVDEAELQMMHDKLVANLHLQGGFDPSKRVDPMVEATTSAPTITPVVAPKLVVTAPVPAGVLVDFADGVQGWTGEYANLTMRRDGGPNGTGVLEIYTPGDGQDGYLIAPDRLLGDWSGNDRLRVTIKTENGRYFDAFEEEAYGDIYLANGPLTAAIAFPTRVSADWTTKEVSFDGTGWVLGGGAGSVAEVIANVTDFRIRGEFLIGNATAWLSSVELIGSAADAPVAAPKPGGWSIYQNPRFGTRIDYPSGRFHALPAPENGDGQTFETADGRMRFLVFGQNQIDGLDARAMMARDRDWGSYDQVTYQTSGSGWYVMTGYVGNKIFYRKVVIDSSAGVVHVFEITYPKAARASLDAVVTRMSKSFGHQTP